MKMEKEKDFKTYSLGRIIKTGWVSFRRNSFLSFGATGVMALALLVLSSLIVFNFFTNRLISFLDEKVDVSVYFQGEAKEDQILKIKSDLENLSSVERVVYVSREQALEDFKARHKDDQLIQDSLAELESNPLQASLNVKAIDAGQYASITNFFEQNSLKTVIDKISFYENEGAIERVRNFSRGLYGWGLLATIALGLVAVLVPFNTIRLTIYNKKEEIEIMKLVGASNWHIRGPFLVEGGLYGFFAAVLALAIFYPGIYLVSDKLGTLASSLNLFSYFVSYSPQMVLVVLGSGLALGIFSSFSAIRRHLKV